jgi:site-specific recombinase XerD
MKMETTQLITRFKQEHYIKGHSKLTIDAYAKNCLKFFEFTGFKPFNITERDIKKFLYRMKKSGKQAATCNQYIFSLKSFYSLFCKDKRINPAINIERIKRPAKIPAIISVEDIRALFDNCGNFKHKAILIVTYSAGLRLSEVQQLKLSDIDSKQMVFKVTGKGNKQRLLPLHKDTLDLLRGYYKIYKPKTWLFEGRIKGKPLNKSTYQVLVRKLAQRAKIKKRVSMHTLRHSYATHLLDHGVSIKIIQELLGHRSLQTTQIYTHVTREMKSKVFSPITLLDLSNSSFKKGGENE